MSDRGLGPPKDYPDPLDPPDPFEDPFAGLKSQTWVRVYLVLALVFVLGLVAMCNSSPEDAKAVSVYPALDP